MIDLLIYADQLTKSQIPISKLLNDAWHKLLHDSDKFKELEDAAIKELEKVL